jgi:hypothetical protein
MARAVTQASRLRGENDTGRALFPQHREIVRRWGARGSSGQSRDEIVELIEGRIAECDAAGTRSSFVLEGDL